MKTQQPTNQPTNEQTDHIETRTSDIIFWKY